MYPLSGLSCSPTSQSYPILIYLFSDTYLQINDQINTVLNRYEAYKKGDFTAAANPIPPELSNGAGPSGSVSLIDFDDAPSQPSAAPAAGGS